MAMLANKPEELDGQRFGLCFGYQEMGSGDGIGLIVLLLPGSDAEVGDKPSLSSQNALCIGIAQPRGAQNPMSRSICIAHFP